MSLQASGVRHGYINSDKQGPLVKQDPTASSHLSLTFPPVPPHSTAYPSNLPVAIVVRNGPARPQVHSQEELAGNSCPLCGLSPLAATVTDPLCQRFPGPSSALPLVSTQAWKPPDFLDTIRMKGHRPKDTHLPHSIGTGCDCNQYLMTQSILISGSSGNLPKRLWRTVSITYFCLF